MNAVAIINNADAYRASTDAAELCKSIVVETAMAIQGRKYVKVEGWQAIALAHGCSAGARDVEKIDGGVRAIGEVRRMSDGALISQAEGFVGEDEPTWYGGETVTKWGKKTLPPRPAYAIRAMAQTRAISRACRSAFAHVVVMMNAGLSTTPAEEVPSGGFDDEPRGEPRNVTPAASEPQKPISAYAAKKGPMGERAAELANEIPDLESVTVALAWRESRADEVAKWPPKWQAHLWDKHDEHITTLREAAAKMYGAVDEGDAFPGDRVAA